MKKKKGIDGKLDQAWSELVKLRAGMKCEITNCGKTKYLNAHHLYTRKNMSVRWDVLNGIALCPSHHTLNSKFSAHGTPIDFDIWLRKYKGDNFVDILMVKAHSIVKWTKFEKEILLKDLKNDINKYKNK